MNDFGLKCCGVEQKCKNNISGSNQAPVQVTRGPENTMVLLLCQVAGNLLGDDGEVYCFTNTLEYFCRLLVSIRDFGLGDRLEIS